MRVLRIENKKDKRGLYSSRFASSSLYRFLLGMEQDRNKRPPPGYDAALNLSGDTGPEDIGWADVHFGFTSKKQIKNWFGKDTWTKLIPLLDKSGFFLTTLQVPKKYTRNSDHQVIFDPAKAKVIKTAPVTTFKL